MAPAEGLSGARGLVRHVPARTRHTCSAPTDGPSSGTSGTRVEHRAVVVPTTHIANCRGERRRAGGPRRGDLRRHAEMPEDPADHGRLLDERDQGREIATVNRALATLLAAINWGRFQNRSPALGPARAFPRAHSGSRPRIRVPRERDRSTLRRAAESKKSASAPSARAMELNRRTRRAG